MNHVLVQEWL